MSDVSQTIGESARGLERLYQLQITPTPAATVTASGTRYRPTDLPHPGAMPAHHGCMTQAVQLTDEEQLCVLDRLLELVEEKPGEWQFSQGGAVLPQHDLSLFLGPPPTNIRMWCGGRAMLDTSSSIEVVKARSAILFDKLHEVRHRYARHEAVMQLEKALGFDMRERLEKLRAGEGKTEVEEGQAKRVEEIKRQVEAITGPEPNYKELRARAEARRQKRWTARALNVTVILAAVLAVGAAVTKAIAG